MIQYFNAKSGICKAFFCVFRNFFKFIFIFAQRPPQNVDKARYPVSQAAEQRREHGAERDAVEQRARGGKEDGVQPCAARAGAQPQKKQPHEHDQRIHEVERSAAEGAAVRTGCAQRIEHQPERKAQHERERREHDLILYRGLHPKSFAQKPSPRCGVSA